MAGENVTEPSPPGDSLEGWLDAQAEQLGVSREELLARLGTGPGGDTEELGALRRELLARLVADHEALAADLDDVRADVEDARSSFDEKIDDVRDRVVQVKREADEKAPTDHDHPDLAPAAVADRADELAAELDDLAATVAELDETVETGFENYEDVLEYLTEATDDLEAKLTTLAEVTVDIRDRTETLAARHAARAAADELATLANRRGVRSADCGHCDQTVHVGLLASPTCPHCASTFSDVEPKQGLFGSPTLVVGEPPALEGERADWAVDEVAADATDHEAALDDILDDSEAGE
ncbi:hypothetical protein [Halorussus marinus]|uniref:hypothetical protein n=1 Tax=Halorussus marinus TaxID=2505976 RepID=UPI001092339D|nr:hypothetical protein [Halorussus marinus]